TARSLRSHRQPSSSTIPRMSGPRNSWARSFTDAAGSARTLARARTPRRGALRCDVRHALSRRRIRKLQRRVQPSNCARQGTRRNGYPEAARSAPGTHQSRVSLAVQLSLSVKVALKPDRSLRESKLAIERLGLKVLDDSRQLE